MEPSTAQPQSAALQSLAAVVSATSISDVRMLNNESPLPLKEPYQERKLQEPVEKTIFYLAYGSNLAAKTFEGRRKIRPLQAINVLVPSLDLVFDLPGVPYMEPCFANTRKRGDEYMAKASPGAPSESEKSPLLDTDPNPHTADDLGWKKGLVGVVYEVTESDFARIIATEGGGSSYSDIEVDCYPLTKDITVVPAAPSGESFTAHTLFADLSKGTQGARRRDGWAEPSARYLGLITSGAAEHGLPTEYQAWLGQLKPYRKTTWQQSVGGALFLATWGPPAIVLFTLQRLLVGKDGRAPAWLGGFAVRLFSMMWASYDRLYKKRFGDGERTIGDPMIA